MYRVTISGHKIYAKEIKSVCNASEDIEALIEDGGAVIIVDEIEDLENIGIESEDVEFV